jgi:hypothetical protein
VGFDLGLATISSCMVYKPRQDDPFAGLKAADIETPVDIPPR